MSDSPRHHSRDKRDLAYLHHRRLIGYLGLLLPVLVYLLAGARSTHDGVPGWGLLGSISEYYHTGGIGPFVGILFALSLFLFTYPGYERADRVVGVLGGLGALGVALCPPEANAPLTVPAWWTPKLVVLHYVAAGVMFTSFILFATWLFRKGAVPERRRRSREKRWRDSLCLACGIVMIGAVLWAARAFFADVTVFWPETIAIEAFAVSWLVKGRAYRPFIRAFRGQV